MTRPLPSSARPPRFGRHDGKTNHSRHEDRRPGSRRVLVTHEGRLAGELPHSAMSEEGIMRLATGRAAA